MTSIHAKAEANRSLRALCGIAPPVAVPPDSRAVSQDSEWFVVKHSGAWRELRLHDYPDIFSIPGLYEKVVYGILECNSPEVIKEELASAIHAAGEDPVGMTVLDLGAGNGVMADELHGAGVGVAREGGFIGADLIPEAAEAAARDRPGLYDEFVVGDITDLPPKEQAKLQSARVDVLTCVAALGFGDIPPEAFTTAFEHVRPNGWVAFCIKDEFVSSVDRSGFSDLIESMVKKAQLRIVTKRRYVHRRAFSGRPLHYVAYIARKPETGG